MTDVARECIQQRRDHTHKRVFLCVSLVIFRNSYTMRKIYTCKPPHTRTCRHRKGREQQQTTYQDVFSWLGLCWLGTPDQTVCRPHRHCMVSQNHTHLQPHTRFVQSTGAQNDSDVHFISSSVNVRQMLVVLYLRAYLSPVTLLPPPLDIILNLFIVSG